MAGKDLKVDIQRLRIALRSELEEFGETFIKVAKKSRGFVLLTYSKVLSLEDIDFCSSTQPYF
ncbi:hypothetical protein LC593_17715 [Nostoc sp. CHAB 5844]|nr:hypothetical protein [Nostoc sp. CHAB 5844]